MNFFDLPDVVIENVFSFLTYDDVAQHRIVCKDFDTIGKRILNRGFHMIERRHAMSLKAIKAMLPRRESERRFHNLSRHCEVLTSIETRLSMLSMTYSKFIDNNLCCFIPGKVIDEIQGILTRVETSLTLPRAHEVLQELRDISSMAIEHFDDKIVPRLRNQMLEKYKNSSTSNAGQVQHNVPKLVPVIQVAKHACTKEQRVLLMHSKKLLTMEKKMNLYKQHLKAQKHMIQFLAKKQTFQNAHIAELKKRVEECDVKYRELTQSQGGLKGITSTSHAVVDPQPPVLRHYSSQIRLDPIPPRNNRLGRESPNIKPRRTTLDAPALNILSQSIGLPTLAKRARLSSMLMEDSGSNSNSSQDIQDITDDKMTNKNDSASHSSEEMHDFKSVLSRVSKNMINCMNDVDVTETSDLTVYEISDENP